MFSVFIKTIKTKKHHWTH